MVIQGYPDPGDGLRLHLNENTGGCSPRVLEAIRQVRPSDVSVYPSYREAVTATARHFGVNPDWVLLTNGLDEGILMAAVGHIAKARVHDAETIIPLPAFDPYPNSTTAVGATAVRVPPGIDFAFPTQAVIDAITPRTRMIFLNTPNNPTGQLIPTPDLVRISEAAPDAVVLIDEAYIEFGGTTFLPELPRFPNVLVGRTFSKAYGLAGMRIGVVIGQPRALDPVRAVTLAVQHQRRRAERVARGPGRHRVPSPVCGPGAGIAGAIVRGVSPPPSPVLAKRGQLRPGARRQHGAVHRGAGRAGHSRAGPVEGSNHARVHPDHRRHDCAHGCGHRRDGRRRGPSTRHDSRSEGNHRSEGSTAVREAPQ